MPAKIEAATATREAKRVEQARQAEFERSVWSGLEDDEALARARRLFDEARNLRKKAAVLETLFDIGRDELLRRGVAHRLLDTE